MTADDPNARSTFEDPRFGALVAALRIAAAEPDAQAAMLDALRSVGEGMQRGEPISSFGAEVAALELPPGVRERVDVIDACFDDLLATEGSAAFSSVALANDPRWARMRTLAREALDALGIPFVP